MSSVYSYGWGYQEAGAWSHPYPDLVLGFHTGMKFGGYWDYGGCRFYDDHPSRSGATEIFSVGDGDSHVRVANNLLVAGTADFGGEVTVSGLLSFDEIVGAGDMEFDGDAIFGGDTEFDGDAIFGGDIAVGGTVDGIDIAARDAVLTSTTTTAGAALPKAGGTVTGDVTFQNGTSIFVGTNVTSNTTEQGIYWHNNHGEYGIYRTGGNWDASDYQQLKVMWGTGIILNGGSSYGKSGIRMETGSAGLWVKEYDTNTVNLRPLNGNDAILISDDSGAATRGITVPNAGGAVIRSVNSSYYPLKVQVGGSDVFTINGSGNIAVTGTFDGVDIATRDAVLTSTTTTANAALPKAGGTMTGVLDLQENKLKFSEDAGIWASGENLIIGEPEDTNKVWATFTDDTSFHLSGTPNLIVDGTGTFAGDVDVTGALNLGSAIGTRDKCLSITTGDTGNSAIAVQTDAGGHTNVWSVLPHNENIYMGTGIYYDGSTWVHQSSNTYNSLFVLCNSSTRGATWYASSNSTGSWNQAADVPLWNTQGQWSGDINTTYNVTFAGDVIVDNTSSNNNLYLKGTNGYPNEIGILHSGGADDRRAVIRATEVVSLGGKSCYTADFYTAGANLSSYGSAIRFYTSSETSASAVALTLGHDKSATFAGDIKTTAGSILSRFTTSISSNVDVTMEQGKTTFFSNSTGLADDHSVIRFLKGTYTYTSGIINAVILDSGQSMSAMITFMYHIKEATLTTSILGGTNTSYFSFETSPNSGATGTDGKFVFFFNGQNGDSWVGFRNRLGDTRRVFIKVTTLHTG